MIPLKLSLTNFLSYRETAILDFRGLHLACIAGLNGAGKSTILDGITWALFGNSRSRSDDDVVNRLAARDEGTAEVNFDFELEGVVYRIIRRKRAGRAMTVEFQTAVDYAAENWKSLTGTGRRETDAEIVSFLRMNFDTFSNASFLLQGRADEFTTKTPGKRKEILADLLGVSQWDRYKELAAARRKAAESQVTLADAVLAEIEIELAEEPARLDALERAKGEHRLAAERLQAQEQILTQARRAEEAVRRQKETLRQAQENLAREQKRLADWQTRQETLQAAREQAAALLAEEDAITAGFAAWEAAHAEVEAHLERANEFNRIKQLIQPQELAIQAARSRLEEEERSLQKERLRVAGQEAEREGLKQQLGAAQKRLAEIETRLAGLAEVQETVSQLLQEKSSLAGAQPVLKEQMDQLQERIDRLGASTGGICPLCGQPLTDAHRDEILAEIKKEGKTLGDQFRANKIRLPEIEGEVKRHEAALAERRQLEQERETQQRKEAEADSRLAEVDRLAAAWAAEGAARLAAVKEQLAAGSFLPEAQTELARLNEALAAVGYDQAAYQAALAARDGLKEAPSRHQALEKARSEVGIHDRNLAELAGDISRQAGLIEEMTRQEKEARETLAALTGDQTLDLPALEREIQRLREEENAASRRIGSAEQLVHALEAQRERRKKVTAERAELTLLVQRLQRLEKACGRDGVQALLIEQALPEIEDAANQLLTRLTEGQMQVTFETQKQLKSREGTAETLDIHISDSAGSRPYENFSGGEQFRVNFAIRIALSQILAKRAGARLQTLVIDEGFGSQDPNGRQRLIEAINAIQDDFKLILIITHIDELRDAFPNRIDVVKTPQGSRLSVS